MPSIASSRRSGRRRPARSRRQTFVSCLFDLDRRERIGGRTVAFFRQHAELVLSLEAPLVVYADPELAPWLATERRARGLSRLTQVIERPFEALDLHAVLPTITRFPSFANAGPRKDTPRHQIVEWSKFDLLREVIDADPFRTDHFAWIDFGIGHVAEKPLQLPPPSERVAMLQMRAVAPAELTDRLEFMGHERGRIAAGFFRGSAGFLMHLVTAFEAELAAVLARRFRPNEQMVLSWLSAARPELFEFYYGDYPSIILNWDFVRRDLETVFGNLAHCRQMSLWDDALRICERIEASQAAGALALTPDDCARLLDEQFVAAWYGGRPDVAHLARRRLLSELAGTTYFAAHESRLRENFTRLPACPTP